MRDGAPDEVLAGACTWHARVTSWLGGRMLAERIPLSSGRVTADAGDDIIESLTMTVPRFAAPAQGADVVDWRPTSPDHPLARYGQILDITLVVSSVITGEVWETRVGRYQIKDWSDDDAGIITVKGESLLARPRDDKLKVLSSPSGTLSSEARRLLPAGMGASFDPALTDRTAPASMSWAKDRLKNLKEIAAAWPALLRIDPWGQVVFRAPLPDVPVPVLTLRDGRGGTLIAAPRSDTRSGAYNEVVASTASSDKPDVQGVAAVTAGPMSANGEYGVVTKEWSSSLIENKQQADAAANTILSNSTRPALAVPARIAPDPRIELDDPVEILRGASGHMETVPDAFSEWVEQSRNLIAYTRPTSGPVPTGWNAAPSASNDGDWVISTCPGGVVNYIFSGRIQEPVTIGDEFTGRITVQSDSASIQYLRVNVHNASAYYATGPSAQVIVGPLTPGAPVDVDVAWIATQNLATNDLNISTVPCNSGGVFIAPPAGAAFRVRHPRMSHGLGSVAFFDGASNPNGELERTRWLGGEYASPSVTETRQVLVPEHRVWVTEAAEDSADADRQWGWVTAFDLPLTVADGDMRVDVGLPS